jgi:hypothetical protein
MPIEGGRMLVDIDHVRIAAGEAAESTTEA